VGRVEIDLKQLKVIEGRFAQLSQTRLERMLASFSLAQSDSIQLLPLLFHVNHPMLPGYVDKSTPCGIPNYSPDKLIKTIAKTVSRSFKYQSRAYLKYEILGLYLMGSAGTLGQSLKSDLDLWICIDDGMDLTARDKLYRKTANISEWLSTRGVELNCYLVGESDFKNRANRDLTNESCGETQHYLLLDEFYRTAIWLCGRKPLWWLIPPTENYAKLASRLLTEKYLFSADWIDFGEVVEIPAAEYFSASLWQLYKSIESPYKSLLKLLLLEVYARHVEETGLLSNQFKYLVYKADEEQHIIDPYLLMLEYAEDFIGDQPARLEFLRRAFYLKSGTKVQLGNRRAVGWRYKTLLELVKKWGWKQERLDYLNQRGQWQIDRVLKEREELVRELNHSYHFLANFARVKGVADQVSQNELLSLGRKLYSVFEKRPGKIEVINTGIVKDLIESTITLHQVSESEWHLFLGSVSHREVAIRKSILSAESYFMLVAWCVCNRIADQSTNVQIFAEDSFLTQNPIRDILRQLLSIQSNKESSVNDQAFQHPAMINKVGIFLNTLADPLEAEKQAGIYSIADQLDHFCWGDSKTNLLQQFETFTSNSWGENVCKQYSGAGSWIKFFIDNREILSEIEEKLIIFSAKIQQPERLKTRLIELLQKWSQLSNNAMKKHRQFRFIMALGKQYLLIDFDPEKITHQILDSHESLFYAMAESKSKDFEWVLDQQLPLPDYFKRIIGRKKDEQTNCFLVRTKENLVETFIKDHDGHIFYQLGINSDQEHLVNYFQQFFDSINLSSSFLAHEADFFQFWYADVTDSKKPLRFNRVKPRSSIIASTFWNIRATACFDSEGGVKFNLSIDNEEYCYRDYGDLVYRKLAQLIKSKRVSGENYPIYLTDLDLSAVNQSPDLAMYFRFKRQVESKLSMAFNKLKPK